MEKSERLNCYRALGWSKEEDYKNENFEDYDCAASLMAKDKEEALKAVKECGDEFMYYRVYTQEEFDVKFGEFDEDDEYVKYLIEQSFRIPLNICSDDTIEIIRFLIFHHEKDIFTDMILGGIKIDADILIKIYNKMKSMPMFKNIKISVSEFMSDISTLFRPELQFEDLGIGSWESMHIYLSLVDDEDNWFRDMFLDISDKEQRELYAEYLKRTEAITI